MDWRVMTLIFGALLLGIWLSSRQIRRYAGEVRSLVSAYAGRDLQIVSGRASRRTRGVIAVLVVDPADRVIVDARLISGMTVLSRPEQDRRLIGPIDAIGERIDDRLVREAVNAAVTMLTQVPQPRPVRLTPEPEPSGVGVQEVGEGEDELHTKAS